jgi:hypothetical protein
VQQRQARRHGNELYEPYRTLSTKKPHSTALFMEIQELGEDQGTCSCLIPIFHIYHQRNASQD